MNIFIAGFWILIAVCLLLFIYTRTALQSNNDSNFRYFQRIYLAVYLLAMGNATLYRRDVG